MEIVLLLNLVGRLFCTYTVFIQYTYTPWPLTIDVPRPLTNDIWVFIFQMIDAECVKLAGLNGTHVYVKAFMINVNKCLKPFFLD